MMLTGVWIGLVLGIAIGIFAMWLRYARNIEVRWYDYLIGGIGLVLIILAVSHYLVSLTESEPQAAWMGLLVIGLLGIVPLAATALQIWRRHQRLA